MNFRKLMVVAVAGAFALPLAAQASAENDRMILAQSSGTSAVGNGPTGGMNSPQSAGEPKAPMAGERSRAGASSSGATSRAPDFSAIDKNGDGQISRAEWDAYHKASGGAASGGATSSGSAASPSGTGKTGTAAGPGEVSPKTGTGSATATKPDTSGTGKAQ